MDLQRLLDRALLVRLTPQEAGGGWRRRVVLLGAVLLFVGGSFLGVRALDLDLREINWILLSVAGLVGVPLTALANALEYRTSAVVLGHRPSFVHTLRVSVLGTAANLLPVPGASMMRIRGLRQLGSGYRRATLVTLVVGLTWILTSTAFVMAWLVASDRPLAAAPFGVATLVLGVVVWMVLQRLQVAGRRRDALASLVGVEVLLVLTGVFREGLVLVSLGADRPWSGALVLTLSAAVAAAAGFFPGGLGLRELVSAILAPLAGLPPALGFVGAAVNRVLGALVHSPLTIWLSLDLESGTSPLEQVGGETVESAPFGQGTTPGSGS